MSLAGRIARVAIRSEACFARPHLLRSSAQLHAFSSNAGEGSTSRERFRERIRDLRSNGTPEIVFGLTLLGLLAADRFVQSQQRNGRDEVVRMLEREVRAAVDERSGATGSFPPETADQPRLFRCAVRRAPENFDGTKCLRGVREGDVVDVLEEGVGPGNAYNLCRVCKEGTNDDLLIGWFPMTCLEKLPQ
mmetsp:Transcript_44340/g.82352  ORF Transcript_44340/g.82352 Transcript_44340/m.82352 type:complete len:191 (-) Transcript_44340:190-762(-)